MWERIERWFWLWVYSTLYFLGLSVTYAVWTEDVTEGTRPALAEIGAPLLALCAALTVLSNTVNANKVAKIPLQDVAPAIFAVISAYFLGGFDELRASSSKRLGIDRRFHLVLSIARDCRSVRHHGLSVVGASKT